MSIAESPSAIERNNGTAKNRPGLEQVLEEERGEPAAQQPDPQDRRDRAAPAWPVSRRCFSHARNPNSTAPPPRISQITGDRPNHVGASGFGCTNPHVPERRIP